MTKDHKALRIWTIYDNPTDFPGEYVARLWLTSSPTEEVIRATGLEELRDRFISAGLVRIPRDESDDPRIVESWL